MLETVKRPRRLFYKIVFNICIYSKLIDILKEIKNIRKDETNFLDNFMFSIYNTIKVFYNHNLIIKVLIFFRKGK